MSSVAVKKSINYWVSGQFHQIMFVPSSSDIAYHLIRKSFQLLILQKVKIMPSLDNCNWVQQTNKLLRLKLFPLVEINSYINPAETHLISEQFRWHMYMFLNIIKHNFFLPKNGNSK